MNKLLSLILILFPLYCNAGVIFMGGAGTSEAVATCNTSSDTVLWDYLGTGTSYSATNAFACNKWTLPGDVTITEYVARYKYISGAGTVKICLIADNGGSPSLPDGTTCIANTDKSLANTAMTAGSFVDYTHTLAAPVDIDSGTYAVVWVCNISSGLTRDFHYYASVGAVACYGNASCNTADNGYIDASVDVYGCEE